jgi:hypothetical protein
MQQEEFEKIKEYLSTPLALYAPRRGAPLKLYVVQLLPKRRPSPLFSLKKMKEGNMLLLILVDVFLILIIQGMTILKKTMFVNVHNYAKMRHYLLSST